MRKGPYKTKMYNKLYAIYKACQHMLDVHMPSCYQLTAHQEGILIDMCQGKTQVEVAAERGMAQSGVYLALKAASKKIKACDLLCQKKLNTIETDDAQCPVNQRKIQEAAMYEVTRKWKAKQELEAATKYNWDESGYIKVPSLKEMRGED